MLTMLAETERSDQRPAPRKVFTDLVYLMLMLGGSSVMLLAVVGEMQPRLTCVAALWSVSGLYGLSEILRSDRRWSAPEACNTRSVEETERAPLAGLES